MMIAAHWIRRHDDLVFCLLSRPISLEIRPSGPLFPNFSHKIFYQFTFYPKSDKYVREFIRHLPSQDIIFDLQELRFEVSVKQMTAKRPSHEGPIVTVSLPSFLATPALCQKSHKLLTLSTQSHIVI
jgi:hypothetical protein